MITADLLLMSKQAELQLAIALSRSERMHGACPREI